MKAVRFVPLAIGCLSLVLTGGCLLAPIVPESYFTMQAPIGVRHDAQTNVVEHLVMKKWFVVHGSIIAEPSTSKCYRTRVYLERTNQSSIRYRSLEGISRDAPYAQKWVSEDWCFRPLSATTNLWLAVQGAGQFYDRSWITNVWERDIGFTVYTFGPKSILSKKHLSAFAARGFPDLILDSQNQRLTYNTRHGYETYNVLEGTISPCGEPPKTKALVPRDFGFKDTSEVSSHFGTNCFVSVQGPRDGYSRNTNIFLIRVYTDYSGKPHHQQVVTTREFADLKRVQVDLNTGVVTYKSESDGFMYTPLENNLKGRDKQQ